MTANKGLATVALVALLALGGSGPARAHGEGGAGGMHGQGMMPHHGMQGQEMPMRPGRRGDGMGPGMHGQGEHGYGRQHREMHRQHMMEQGETPGMHRQGMHRRGMRHRDKRGPGIGGPHLGKRVVPIRHISTDDVRHYLEHRLERQGYTRLKVGPVEEKDDDTITAEIQTVDDSLVQRLEVDRHSGRMNPVE